MGEDDRCPGFGQDRVNFHQNSGRGTAGWAYPTPTWPNRAGYSIPCAVMLGSGGRGGQRGGNSLAAQERAAPVLFGRVGPLCEFVSYFLLICIVVVAVPFVCCSVNLPLSRPTSFCLFLSILLRTAAGGGAAAWRFCCRRQPKLKQHGTGGMWGTCHCPGNNVPKYLIKGCATIWQGDTHHQCTLKLWTNGTPLDPWWWQSLVTLSWLLARFLSFLPFPVFPVAVSLCLC